MSSRIDRLALLLLLPLLMGSGYDISGGGTGGTLTDGDKGDITVSGSGATWNIDPDSVALGIDTTGNYAAGDAEAGNALTGDTATAFFSTGELERTLLPAASADCTAGQFAKGIDADLVLDCAAPAPRTACVAIEDVSGATLKPFWIAPDAGATITAWRCNYFDTCSTAPQFEIEDQGAVVLGTTPLTCVSGAGSWNAISSNNTLSGGEILYVDITNTPTATCDILLCVQYTL